MPSAPPRPCSFPGCGELVYDRIALCPLHRPMNDHVRGSASARYGSSWERFAKDWLRRHPFCAWCGAPASEVDHIDGNRRGRNVRSLCASCHDKRTWADQPGGAAARAYYDRQ